MLTLSADPIRSAFAACALLAIAAIGAIPHVVGLCHCH